MSLKGQRTASEPIPWDKYKLYLLQLESDGEYKMCLISIFGAFFLMRIGDILDLKWEHLLNEHFKGKSKFVIVESKNRRKLAKKREIEVNESVKAALERIFKKMGIKNLKDYIFLREDGSGVVSKQYINQKLKTINKKYKLGLERFSSHSFRKTYAREYWERNGKSEVALRYLKNALGHRSIEDTEIYIGIRSDEIVEVYKSLNL